MRPCADESRRTDCYFDQAHFGREFRAFTGFTPTRYVAKSGGGSCANIPAT